MNIIIEKETDIELDFDYEELLNNVINYVTDYEKCPYELEVNVLLTDNESIHDVNNRFRGIDRPTDVLSFPAVEYKAPGDFSDIEDGSNMTADFNPESGELILGDIMISLEKVLSQAKEYGHSSYREMGFLTAHSMLHLFGYDHMEDEEREVMEKKQSEIMDGLKIYR